MLNRYLRLNREQRKNSPASTGPATPALQTAADLPHQLLESAESRAGLDPRQARELRRAAITYLGVVR